jgi:hypothetical protein
MWADGSFLGEQGTIDVERRGIFNEVLSGNVVLKDRSYEIAGNPSEWSLVESSGFSLKVTMTVWFRIWAFGPVHIEMSNGRTAEIWMPIVRTSNGRIGSFRFNATDGWKRFKLQPPSPDGPRDVPREECRLCDMAEFDALDEGEMFIFCACLLSLAIFREVLSTD